MSEEHDLFPLPLDDRLGPALPLAPDVEHQLLAVALMEVRAPARKSWVAIAAAAALLLGAPAAVAAWMYAERRTPEPERPRPVKKSAPVPLPPPPVQIEVAEPAEVPVQKKKRKRKAEAEDLLAKANALRRESRWREAEAIYLRVPEVLPKGGSSYVALVAAASLRLEHLGDPQGALSLLARAERTKRSGPLAAEILWNRSRAHRALGDEAREESAIERLLREHPAAPFAEAARARLKELEDRSK